MTWPNKVINRAKLINMSMCHVHFYSCVNTNSITMGIILNSGKIYLVVSDIIRTFVLSVVKSETGSALQSQRVDSTLPHIFYRDPTMVVIIGRTLSVASVLIILTKVSPYSVG